MSLTLLREPAEISAQNAGGLPLGTWFLDHEDNIFAIVLDDRTNEKRIICVGDFCRPFIAANPARNFKVQRILRCGTVFQVTTVSDKEVQHGQ